MIEFLHFNKEDLLAIRVTNKISNEDFSMLKEELIKKTKQFGKIKWYYELVSFDGWKLDAFFKDLKQSLTSINNFVRVAFVGDKVIEDIMANFYSLISPAEVKYFELTDKENAYKWVVSDINKNT
ncbi:MAG: STAS/SEC14 domain-containing protein [Ignavibacteriaceae bacterium]